MDTKLGAILKSLAGNRALGLLGAAALGVTTLGLGIALAIGRSKGGSSPQDALILVMLLGQIAVSIAMAARIRMGFVAGMYFCFVQAVWNIIQLSRASTARSTDVHFGDGPFHFAFAAWFVALGAVIYLATPAAPEAAASGAAPAQKKPVDPLDWSRDNIEAIVVAFLMALIIRCFCVEVFKIPTGSMEPTLYGDTKPEEPGPPHSGDRIMVDKVGLIFHGISRFDVCVFKYPLDRSRNFIKRIVGLPDEDFQVDHGDIWTRPHKGGDGKFHLARKPPHEQAGIWLPVWPDKDSSAAAGEHDWSGAPAGSYLDGATFEASGTSTTFRFAKAVTDTYRSNTSTARVNDLVLRFRATMAAGSELHVTDARSDGYGRFTATIAADGTVTFTHLDDNEATFTPLPAPAPGSKGAIAPGAEIEVAFFDGAVRVRIAGNEVAAWEYVDVLPEHLHVPETPAFPVNFGAKGGVVKFENVWLGRDIHYNESGGRGGESALVGRPHGYLEIPEGKYLAIGDNVNNSKDGRLWRLRTVELKSGETWTGDGDSQENYPQHFSESGLQCFRDLDGTDHWFHDEDVKSRGDMDRPFRPFVSQEEMVGKALIVWWPLSRFKVIR